MTLPFISNINQTNLISSTIKNNYSIFNLRPRQHFRLLSTSKLPNKLDSDQSFNSEQDEKTNNPSTNSNENTEDILKQSFHQKAKEKISNYSTNFDLSNSNYLKPIQKQIGSIRAKLSQELGNLPTRLSQVTGYGDIDKLKRLVSEKEADLKAGRAAAFEAKVNFNQAAQRRAESVKEVNDLLSRKASWSDQDLARFTMLVRTDHSNEQAESEAKKLLEQSELKVDHQFTSMMQAILTRYHEEQIWSDKIRALSTTFSLSITVINVLVFLAAIVLVEPYKRSKVVSEVEARITARDSSNSEILDRALNEVVDRLSSTEKELSELILALHAQSSDLRGLDETSPTEEQKNETIDKGVEDISPEVIELSPAVEELPSGVEESSSGVEESSSGVEEFSPGVEESSSGVEELTSEFEEEPSRVDPLPSSWTDKVYNLIHGDDWLGEIKSDQDVLTAIGLGTVIGIILMTGFQFYSRKPST